LDIDAPPLILVRARMEIANDRAVFLDGDVLVVTRGVIRIACDLLIERSKGETFVKRLAVLGRRSFLLSENPKYPPRYVLEGDDLVISGT